MTGISTERLTLARPSMALSDVRQMVEWLNDRDLMKYSEQRHIVHTIGNQYKYIDSFVWPNIFWAIIHRTYEMPGFQMIGTITAKVDRQNNTAEIGIMIGDKSKQGQGFGAEAWAGMMKYLFDDKIRRIDAGCMSRNRRMVGIFIKTQMRLEGIRRASFVMDDGTIDDMELWGKLSGQDNQERSEL